MMILLDVTPNGYIPSYRPGQGIDLSASTRLSAEADTIIWGGALFMLVIALMLIVTRSRN